ncbi:MAG: hypothetical protein ABSG59_09045 [Verrucomicrobiota bacterium]|jgi:hypothetical protein
MLHDPSHRPQPITASEIQLQPAEEDVLRRLVAQLGQIAALPVQREKAELWRCLNDLESDRPMVWINEIPWHEMNVNDELTLHTRHPWAREWETTLRQTLYQWRHLPADMIVSDFMECPLAINSTDFGIIEDVELAKTDEANPVVSRHFNIQIRDWPDLEKIKMPRITHFAAATEERFRLMSAICSDLMPVRKVGQTHIWFTPWDYLIRWWGVQEAMLDLVDRPEFVHAAVDRMVAAWNTELDQFIEQNLLSPDANNTRIGSGGYGFTKALPNPNCQTIGVKPRQMWGCSNAQIFSEVSPEMHWEFALQHDFPWLSRWGLIYYGCCEPLDFKLDLLRRIVNLRKISMNYRVKVERAVRNVADQYVFSYKPNPAIFATDNWRPEEARRELITVLERARGCHVEIIMKDISTVRYQPQRLWEWAAIAMDLVQRFRS